MANNTRILAFKPQASQVLDLHQRLQLNSRLDKSACSQVGWISPHIWRFQIADFSVMLINSTRMTDKTTSLLSSLPTLLHKPHYD